MATAKKSAAKKTLPKKSSTKNASETKSSQAVRGRNQDRALIAATQKYEVTYEASKDGHSVADVKAAIEQFGHSRVKIRKALEDTPATVKKAAKKAKRTA